MEINKTEEKELRDKIFRVKALSEMVVENSSFYLIEKEEGCGCAYAGTSFPKNSNYSKSALKNQIVTLRNELLLLSDKL